MMMITLTGIAAPWDVPSKSARPPKRDEPQANGRWYYIQHAPGAFTRSLLRRDDVPLVLTHNGEDRNLILARTSDGSLTLTDTPAGLRFEARVEPREPWVIETIRRARAGRYGVSAAYAPYFTHFRELNGRWTKIIIGADLAHIALEPRPAFSRTWVAIIDET